MHAVPATPEGAAERWQRRHCVAVRKTAVYQAWHFLFGKSLSLAAIVELVYLWVHDNVSCDTLHHELDMSNHTLVDWKSFCRDICGEHFLANPVVVGGPGIVVEIDESLLPPQIQCRPSRTRTVGFRRDRGGYTRQEGVFGGRPAP